MPKRRGVHLPEVHDEGNFFLLWSLVSGIISCRRPTEDGETKGIILQGAQWPNGMATVCWDEDSYAAIYLDTRRIVEQVVREQYNQRSNMKFISTNEQNNPQWRSCRTAIADIKANIVPLHPGRRCLNLPNAMA